MKKILVTGSIAYDNLLTFNGDFSDSILPEKIDNLSVSFQADQHEVHYGGCSTNIGYSIRLLGDMPLIFAVAGNDFEKYEKWLKANDISDEYIRIDESRNTAAAYILTDKKHSQICIFSTGAMQSADKFDDVSLSGVDADFAIISPGMLSCSLHFAEECMKNKIPYIFDPGQSIPDLSVDALLAMIDGARGVIMNGYEADMLAKKLSMSFFDIAKRTPFVLKTLGADGVEIHESGKSKVVVPAISGLDVKEPTGCGDAFRSGFLHGFVNGESLDKSCAMGNTSASFVVEQFGTQNHKFSKEEFEARLGKI